MDVDQTTSNDDEEEVAKPDGLSGSLIPNASASCFFLLLLSSIALGSSTTSDSSLSMRAFSYDDTPVPFAELLLGCCRFGRRIGSEDDEEAGSPPIRGLLCLYLRRPVRASRVLHSCRIICLAVFPRRHRWLLS